MRTKERRKDAAQRYLNALWHLYSKSDIVTSMSNFCNYHNISHNVGTLLKQHKYIEKIDGQYVYAKYDAPTIHDAKFLLKKLSEARFLSKPKESLPVKKIVKKEKEPNVWMYIAVISMFTTLVTIALVLLR